MYSNKWIFILLFSISCNQHIETVKTDGTPGNSSLISTSVATISQCLNGGYLINSGLDLNRDNILQLVEIQETSIVCNGERGSVGNVGAIGPSGSNGHSSLIVSDAVSNSVCTTGGYIFTTGLDLNDDNTLSITEITSSSIVCNGLRGSDGNVGVSGPMGPSGPSGTNANVSAFLPVAAIQPCGPSSSSYKEVLLGMSGGYLFAEFTGGSSTSDVRNVFIPDGSYTDTDSSHCQFSVVTSSNGNRTVSWSGGSAVYTKTTLSWTVTY